MRPDAGGTKKPSSCTPERSGSSSGVRTARMQTKRHSIRHRVSSKPGRTRPPTIWCGKLSTHSITTVRVPSGCSSCLLLSKILVERGEFDEALKLAEAALARFSVLDRAPLEAEALYLFARIHELMGDPLMAYNGYLRCEHCIARMRRQLTPGYLRTSFLSDKDPYTKPLSR